MDYVTKDSGKRQDFPSGMRRDTQDGKPDFSLVMPLDVPYLDQMLTRWAALMARGAVKYGERNWELSDSEEEYRRFKASAFRHFMQWFCGVDDGEDHAAAIFFNVSAVERLRPIHDCVPVPKSIPNGWGPVSDVEWAEGYVCTQEECAHYSRAAQYVCLDNCGEAACAVHVSEMEPG